MTRSNALSAFITQRPRRASRLLGRRPAVAQDVDAVGDIAPKVDVLFYEHHTGAVRSHSSSVVAVVTSPTKGRMALETLPVECLARGWFDTDR